MNFVFRGKRISGLLAVVPANEGNFLDEMQNFNFPKNRSIKLKEVMGYDKHRLVESGVCVSDLALFGLRQLIAVPFTGFLRSAQSSAPESLVSTRS